MGFFNKEIKIGQKWIGENYHPTYFIAEIGANFDGNLEKAKRLIDAAKSAGADCAKFQTFSTSKIVSEGGFSRMQLKGVHGSWGRTVSEVFKDAEFPVSWHREIAEYCHKIGLDFSTSPYFKEAVDLCVDLDVPFIKIGSGDITWLEMIDYIANVNVLKTYQSAYEVLTGYSDHAPGHVVALASTVIGGRVIEKHFTLCKTDKGPDHPHSMEPNEFKYMVDSVREVERAMGSTRKEVVAEEAETVFVQRRCLYAKNTLQKGQIITADDIDVLRPALGIPPKFKSVIIGKVCKENIEKGQPLFWENF